MFKSPAGSIEARFPGLAAVGRLASRLLRGAEASVPANGLEAENGKLPNIVLIGAVGSLPAKGLEAENGRLPRMVLMGAVGSLPAKGLEAENGRLPRMVLMGAVGSLLPNGLGLLKGKLPSRLFRGAEGSPLPNGLEANAPTPIPPAGLVGPDTDARALRGVKPLGNPGWNDKMDETTLSLLGASRWDELGRNGTASGGRFTGWRLASGITSLSLYAFQSGGPWEYKHMF